ncbi:MAG TPA: hypothetical protein VHJ20_12975 [Polyangia bacterium]|nr:hypothetical protein [Polyangia bacterium]
MATAGATLDDDLSLGAFASALRQGGGRDETTGAAVDGTTLALVTAGVAATRTFVPGWRALASLSFDVPIAGRNELAGVDVGVSILRVWP